MFYIFNGMIIGGADMQESPVVRSCSQICILSVVGKFKNCISLSSLISIVDSCRSAFRHCTFLCLLWDVFLAILEDSN